MVGDGHFDIKSLNSHEDIISSLQYQYYIKQTADISDENKYQLGDY